MNDTPADTSPLFRPEAVASRRPRSQGDIVLLPGPGSRAVAIAAWVLLIALVLLLTLGSYARRSTVSGVLAPNGGLIRVTAGQPGVVVEAPVREGGLVHKGDVLFVLSGDRVGPDAHEFQRDMARQIESRRQSLTGDQQRLVLSEQQEVEQLNRRMASLRTEADQAKRQLEQQQVRTAGAEDAAQRYQALFRQGYVSRDELHDKEAALAELRGQAEALRRDMQALDRQLGEARREVDSVHTRYAIQRSELSRAAMQAKQEYTELESRRRVVVTAPADGQVTLVRAEVGQTVEVNRPLAHLVPQSTELVARLYAPSRSAGFVRVGMPVRLRYDAFPHQEFGQQTGKVLSVSSAAATTGELNESVQRPEWATEPVFAITVALPAQAMQAGGQALPLQSGMKVEADLIHESRRLYEWILLPLTTARSRIANG
jgi:membrane fusion protein